MSISLSRDHANGPKSDGCIIIVLVPGSFQLQRFILASVSHEAKRNLIPLTNDNNLESGYLRYDPEYV